MNEADAQAMLENSSADAQPVVDPAPTQTSESVESFTNIDPSTLTGEAKALYDSMLGDYTRKTQEVAPWRKAFDGVDIAPDEARTMIDFYNNLNSDPEFAMSVYEQLGEALQPFREQSVIPSNEPSSEVDPTSAKLSELEQKIKQFEEIQRFNAGAAELQRQEMALRSMHQDWKDEDMTAVYEIAQAYDGNLLKAGEAYVELQNRIIASYLSSKGGVNPAVASAGSGRSGGEPVEAPADTAEAHRRAVELLTQQLSS